MSELESATNINDVADSLSNCLKMFAENVRLTSSSLNFFKLLTVNLMFHS